MNASTIALLAINILRELPEDTRIAAVDTLLDGLTQPGRAAVLGKFGTAAPLVDLTKFTEVLEGTLPEFITVIRVVVGKQLSQEQARSVGAGIGYSFARSVRGESRISEPSIIALDANSTTIEFTTDTRLHGRSSDASLDYDDTFETALEYIRHGSPIRKTDREGQNTKGTRLVTGIGNVDITFYVADI